ncbi:MAG: hypothetical protein JWM96_49 [Alphaproteobacteria bacterium]|nr:hypothetical protein [Alphaproteobacteria bacterium]
MKADIDTVMEKQQTLPKAAAGKTNSQWIVLAGLRFILAFFVSATHLFKVAPDSALVLYFGGLGHAALFIFFMISGYSIAASIKARPQGYLARRIVRIYPVYLFALAFCVLLMLGGPLHSPQGEVIHPSPFGLILQNLFMMQGIWADTIEYDRPLWTLGVEWWCYMAAPLLVGMNSRFMAWAALVVFIFIIFYTRHYMGIKNSSNMPMSMNILFWVSTWMGGFFFYRDRKPGGFILMLFPSIVMFTRYVYFPYSIFLLVVCALVIAMVAKIDIKDKKIRAVMEWLGDVSYPYYLLHFPLFYAITTYTDMRNGSAIMALAVGLVFSGYYGVTMLAGKMSRPIRQLLFYRPRTRR